MKTKNIIIFFIIFVILNILSACYFFFDNSRRRPAEPYPIFFSNSGKVNTDLDPTPKNVTLSGVYVCLPHKDNTRLYPDECTFGIKTDDGKYYAVNFGASSQAIKDFTNGKKIKAEGFTVIKEALSANQWGRYNMEGIFTVTKMLSSSPAVQGKLNINVVCEESLMYMTFENGEKADKFVAECKEGKYPEVIEQYKERMGLGDGATI